MKIYYKITFIILALLLLQFVTGCSQPAFLNKAELSGRTILIDAGHGDTDVGTIGVTTGCYEKDINLDIARKLEQALIERGVNVVMIRASDAPLGSGASDDLAVRKEEDMLKREQMIEQAGADLFISIHQNAFDDYSVSGPQVFYLRDQNGEQKGKELAETIQKQINDELGVDKPRNVNHGNLRLLKKGKQSGCLIECGFLSNEKEELLLQTEEYQNKLVAAIINGIENYVNRYGV